MILVREAHDLAKLDTACYKIGQSSQRSRIHRMRSNHETPDTIISYGAIHEERSVPNNLHRDKKNFRKKACILCRLNLSREKTHWCISIKSLLILKVCLVTCAYIHIHRVKICINFKWKSKNWEETKWSKLSIFGIFRFKLIYNSNFNLSFRFHICMIHLNDIKVLRVVLKTTHEEFRSFSEYINRYLKNI